jgi:hypothetical protein
MKTVIEMAREAGFTEGELAFMGDNFIRFADLVRADEREACAKVCEEPTEQTYEVTTSWDGFESTRQMRLAKTDRDCAAAIRARSNT